MDVVKVNFAMNYLVVQSWFKIGLDQEEQEVYQDWLQSWAWFTEGLYQHFRLSDFIRDIVVTLDNLQMKMDDRISIYNIDFMKYLFQLRQRDNILCHQYYQVLRRCGEQVIVKVELTSSSFMQLVIQEEGQIKYENLFKKWIWKYVRVGKYPGCGLSLETYS